MKSLLATLTLLATVVPAWGQDVPGFQKTWGDALKLAKEQNKPIFLHFTTTWCKACRELEKQVYAADAGKKALKDFIPTSLDCTVANTPTGTATPTGQTKINIDLFERFTGERDTSVFPALIVVSPDGEAMLNKTNGNMPIEQFRAVLAKAQKMLKEYNAFKAEIANADTESYDFNAKAMKTYATFRMNPQGIAAAEKILQLDPNDVKGGATKANLLILDILPSDASQDQIQPVVDRIKAIDPQNKKGALEKALLTQCRGLYKVALSLNPPQRTTQLAAARDFAKETIATYPKASNLAALYDLVILASLKLEDFAQTIQWANKVVHDHPKFPNAKMFSMMIPKWQAELDKRSPSPERTEK